MIWSLQVWAVGAKHPDRQRNKWWGNLARPHRSNSNMLVLHTIFFKIEKSEKYFCPITRESEEDIHGSWTGLSG